MLNHLKDDELYNKLRLAARMWFRGTDQLALEELIRRYERQKAEKSGEQKVGDTG